MLRLIFTVFFHFFLFYISHSNVIHRVICVKDFSGTTAPRILKFGTNVGYDLLYCVKENQHAAIIIPLFVHFSFSPIKLFVTEFSAPITARVFKVYIHLERGQVCCGKENQDFMFKCCLLFPFFIFSVSHSNIIHREICVNEISQELLRLGFWNLVQMLGMTCCIVEKRISMLLLIIPLICPFLFLSKQIFCYKCLSFYESQSLQILYTHWGWPSILRDKKQNSDLFCLISPFFHLSLQFNT